MAAKNKFKGLRGTALSREDADLQGLLGLHRQACRRADEVEEQIQELQAAGKFPEARVLRMHSLAIQQGLRATEAEVRALVRSAKARPAASPHAARFDPAQASDPNLFGSTTAATPSTTMFAPVVSGKPG